MSQDRIREFVSSAVSQAAGMPRIEALDLLRQRADQVAMNRARFAAWAANRSGAPAPKGFEGLRIEDIEGAEHELRAELRRREQERPH